MSVDLYLNPETAVCAHEKVSEVYNPETEILTTTCLYCGHVTESACEHTVVTNVAWNDTKKVYEGTCAECNKTVEKTMLYTTESDADGAVGSKANYIMSYQENGFVRYKAEKDPNGDSYFFPLRNNKEVTGQYMVIKYRAENKGNNLSVGVIYASSAASGGVPGAAGSSSNAVLTSKTLYADGEWHYIVISPNLNSNASFTANADGTYSWAYIRTVVSGWSAFDKSCYLDIDEIAFADNEVAVWNYTGGTHTPIFNAHSQVFKVNGESVTLADVDGEAFAYDVNAEVESMFFDAWVCTPGGVDAYYIRVTKIDGEAVAAPTLVKWHEGNDRGDIYTAVGKNKGYSSTCSTGAGFSANIDLSAYAGSKIDIQVVAMTNGGAEAVIASFTNITVAEEDPNFVVTASKLAGQTEHKGLTYAISEDGEYVTYTHKAGSEWDDCFAYVIFPSANVNVPTETTGEYILIKYKTTSTLAWGMFAGANNGSTQAAGGKDSFSVGIRNGDKGVIINDGEWQYLIIDTSTFLKDWGGVLPEDGTEDVYSIDYFRIDYFNDATEGGETVDVAYVAFSDSVDELVEYAGMTSYIYADSYSGGLQGTVVTVGE